MITGNRYTDKHLLLRQQYDFGIKDSVVQDSSVVRFFYPKFRLEHTVQSSGYAYHFLDVQARNAENFYNLACSYALANNADKAFANWENIFSSNGYQPRAPGVLYNAMIHPLVPFDIAGAMWYQGESNTVKPFVYRRLFPTMIQSWRDAWEKDFPFYYCKGTHEGYLHAPWSIYPHRVWP